ncbi:MAG: rhodanese-like domain-containing protein [Sphingobacteriaceae bacterium]|nr:rhodanese-like domain-containing protein [Sphingobacteriaceae bacterium]
MTKGKLILTALAMNTLGLFAQSDDFTPAKVDFDAYEKLVAEVKEHRKSRLVNLETFLKMSKEDKVIIIDTRSDAMYKSKHVKGAVHLNFSDFTQATLARLIKSKDTKILIYCNNNFDKDDDNFPTKAYVPAVKKEKTITMALNIPTYINLYGYDYKNVYELFELVSIYDTRIKFEGTSMPSN